jgi:hypothetical protein
MKFRCWGSAIEMSDRERKKLEKFIRANSDIKKSEPIEFVSATESEMKRAAEKELKSARGGTDGG